jgi:hypothetical protein
VRVGNWITGKVKEKEPIKRAGTRLTLITGPSETRKEDLKVEIDVQMELCFRNHAESNTRTTCAFLYRDTQDPVKGSDSRSSVITPSP